jgi:pimeloyl-ACP methyl ester carboxylesterase
VKTSLLLVPGLLCDATVWADQVAGLKTLADIQIAENGPRDSLVAMAEAIIAQAPPRFALAGHSMGGRVAMEVMRRVPERVQGLALMDTGYEPLADGEVGQRETEGRMRMVQKAREQGMNAMGRAWVQGMVLPSRLSDRALVDPIIQMIERRTPEYYAAQTQALLTRPDATSVLEGIRCPTLVLCGREDAWSPLDRHRQMAALIPGSRLAAIDRCGHMSTMEQPAAVTAELRRWLEDLPT